MKETTTGSIKFDKDGRFIVEKFDEAVNSIQELAVFAGKVQKENQGLKEQISRMIEGGFAKHVSSERRVIEGARGKTKVRNTYNRHPDTGFKYVTNPDGFHVSVYFKSPETGRTSSVGGNAKTLPEAVILRNEKAGKLVLEHLLSFEEYLDIVRN